MRDIDPLDIRLPVAPLEEGVALSTFPGATRRDWVWREAAALLVDLPALPGDDEPRP